MFVFLCEFYLIFVSIVYPQRSTVLINAIIRKRTRISNPQCTRFSKKRSAFFQNLPRWKSLELHLTFSSGRRDHISAQNKDILLLTCFEEWQRICKSPCCFNECQEFVCERIRSQHQRCADRFFNTACFRLWFSLIVAFPGGRFAIVVQLVRHFSSGIFDSVGDRFNKVQTSHFGKGLLAKRSLAQHRSVQQWCTTQRGDLSNFSGRSLRAN